MEYGECFYGKMCLSLVPLLLSRSAGSTGAGKMLAWPGGEVTSNELKRRASLRDVPVPAQQRDRGMLSLVQPACKSHALQFPRGLKLYLVDRLSLIHI